MIIRCTENTTVKDMVDVLLVKSLLGWLTHVCC